MAGELPELVCWNVTHRLVNMGELLSAQSVAFTNSLESRCENEELYLLCLVLDSGRFRPCGAAGHH